MARGHRSWECHRVGSSPPEPQSMAARVLWLAEVLLQSSAQGAWFVPSAERELCPSPGPGFGVRRFPYGNPLGGLWEGWMGGFGLYCPRSCPHTELCYCIHVGIFPFTAAVFISSSDELFAPGE